MAIQCLLLSFMHSSALQVPPICSNQAAQTHTDSLTGSNKEKERGKAHRTGACKICLTRGQVHRPVQDFEAVSAYMRSEYYFRVWSRDSNPEKAGRVLPSDNGPIAVRLNLVPRLLCRIVIEAARMRSRRVAFDNMTVVLVRLEIQLPPHTAPSRPQTPSPKS